MPVLRKYDGGPAKVWGPEGVCVEFNAEGISGEVTDKVAAHFVQVAGYQIVKTEPAKTANDQTEPANDQTEPANDQTEPGNPEDFDMAEFKMKKWQTQKSAIEKGEVPPEALELIAEGEFPDSVRKAALAKLNS